MNIMIANESRLLGEGVSMIIKSSFDDADILVTDSAKDVIRNLNRPSNSHWQVILIDATLSKLIDLKRLRTLLPDTKVCLFNSKEPLQAHEYLKTGFNGILTELSSSNDLKQAIKTFLSGRDFFPEADNTRAKGFFKIAHKINQTTLITHREQDILSLMSLGLSNKEIACHCDLAEATVKRHISNTFKKLGVKNRVEAAHLATERGLLH